MLKLGRIHVPGERRNDVSSACRKRRIRLRLLPQLNHVEAIGERVSEEARGVFGPEQKTGLAHSIVPDAAKRSNTSILQLAVNQIGQARKPSLRRGASLNATTSVRSVPAEVRWVQCC